MNGFLTWLVHGPEAARRRNTERILRALSAADGPLSGLRVARSARVSAGAVYVALVRLEREGLVTSRWEILPAEADRPRRRQYELTDAGTERARELAARTEAGT